jgi:hypothetical protein
MGGRARLQSCSWSLQGYKGGWVGVGREGGNLEGLRVAAARVG